MALEGNAFAALLANLEKRLQIDGEKRYFTFPPFALGMRPDELIFDVHAMEARSGEDLGKTQSKVSINQEEFSILVNQIPPVTAVHLTDGWMLWDVYERIINTADLPLDELDDEEKVLDITAEFSKYRSDFSLAEQNSVKAGGSTYYATGTSPSGEDITWTAIPLDKSKFNELGAGVSKGVQAWLSESDLLNEPMGADISIKSLSIEVSPMEVRRSWLNPRVFENRSWNWDDQPLSDGGSPPQGILPAYVVGVLLVRNLVIDLDVAAKPSDSSSPSRAFKVAKAASIRRLRAFKPPVMSVRPFTVANRQRIQRLTASRTPVVSARLLTARAVAANPVQANGSDAAMVDGLDPSVYAFPVPPSFHCDKIIAETAMQLQRAESELATLNQQKLTVQQQVSQLEQQTQGILNQLKSLARYGDAEKVTIRDHRGGATTTRVLNIRDERNKLNQELGRLKQDLADKSTKLSAGDNQIKGQSDLVDDLREALEEWQGLASGEPEGDAMFILGFICQRLPKSPDPDPQLFSA